MPTPCSICSHPELKAIEQALIGKASIRSIAKSFGVGRNALQHHLGFHSDAKETRDRRAAAKGVKRQRRAAAAPEAPAKAIRSTEAVFAELDWQYAEIKALYEEAKSTRDWRLADKALAAAGSLIDKYAKALKVYDDGFSVNIDARTVRVSPTITEDFMKEYIRAVRAGEPPPPLPSSPAIEGDSA